MANSFYQPGEQRAAKVNALFNTIASRYDLINDLQSFGLHRRWKRRVVRLAKARSGDRALDLCCGTGDIALALAAKGADVIGLDFNEAMLQVARTKAKPPQTPCNLKFVRGDAQELPFPDAAFDIITVGYGLRNLADWKIGVSEMARVAKPGARIISLDFGKPDQAFWRWIYFSYLRLFVPLLGLAFCRNASAYAYILESLKHYPAQHGVAEKMRALGLVNVQIHNILGGAMSLNYAEKSPSSAPIL